MIRIRIAGTGVSTVLVLATCIHIHEPLSNQLRW